MTRIEDLEPGEAMLVDWSAERYHGDRSTVSRSMLEDLRARGPRYFLGRHVLRTIHREQSAALRFGSLAHEAVLEPVPWRRTRLMLEIDERNLMEAIAKAVHSHSMVREMMAAEGGNERTVIWRDEETGLLLRQRPDTLRDIGDAIICGDLKTSAHQPTGDNFAKYVARYGCHRQAAQYLDAVAALYPGVEVHFVFIAVHKQAPFEVACYELPPDALDLGRRQYRATLTEYAERIKTNDWAAPWERGVNELILPGWAFYEE